MALYNKYRPQNLDTVCGQPQVKRILKSQITKNDLVHTYLFHGPAGTGKTTVARILAAMINATDGMTCDPKMSDPLVAQIIDKKSGIDVLEFDAASNRGIDDVKAIREKAYHAPMEMRKKIYIIDECHMLTREAWNALLKLLEEPPKHAIFILCTTDKGKVLETVRTRCMSIPFKSLSCEEIAQYLKMISGCEKILIVEEALRQIALSAKGSVRDAISKLEALKHNEGTITVAVASDQLGVAMRPSAAAFVGTAINGTYIDALKASSPCISSGVKPEDFFSRVAEVLHDIYLCGAKGYEMVDSGYSKEEAAETAAFKDKLSELCGGNYRRLVRQWIGIIQEASELTVFNTQPQYQVDVAFVNMKMQLQTEAKAHESTKSKGG